MKKKRRDTQHNGAQQQDARAVPETMNQDHQTAAKADDSTQPEHKAQSEVQHRQQPPSGREKLSRWVGDQLPAFADKWNSVLQVIVPSAFSFLILIAIGVQAYIYHLQWKSMQDSIAEIKQNRELEYRAQVGVKAALFQPRQDNPVWADVMLVTVNTGRTMARGGARIKRILEVRNSPPPDDIAVEREDVGSRIAYVPNIEYTTYMGGIQTELADILRAQQTLAQRGIAVAETAKPKGSPTPPTIVPKLEAPKMPDFGPGYYLYGVIDYKDIFDRPHWTKFCFYIAPGTSTFLVCPTFNDSN